MAKDMKQPLAARFIIIYFNRASTAGCFRVLNSDYYQ